MKILIGFDGSKCAESALDDLRAAGMPPVVEAHVMSVADVWLPPPPPGVGVNEYVHELRTRPQPFKAWQTNARLVSEADGYARRAADRLRGMFPLWKVTFEGTYGSPAWELIEKAGSMNADLVVVGSHGFSALHRMVLGSISQKVLTEAKCSVRIARGKVEVDPSPVRIVIGYDGSAGAIAAVDAVASRNWPEGSEVRLAAITDLNYGSTMELYTPILDDREQEDWVNTLTSDAISRLTRAGLKCEVIDDAGSPKALIVDIAEKWNADCIFVGANHYGGAFERFLLGSVSAAVAARAHCSVEVVRRALT
jgi:nucleotide-binding universal stress UspA family protein